jgi:4-phytase/acid phosphatase
MNHRLLFVSCLFACISSVMPAQSVTPPSSREAEELKFVVYLSRHGVRSPTGKLQQYNQYSAAPWPAWDVQPGYLTQHGYRLMELFGAYDRMELTNQHLLSEKGCAEADHVTFYADSDQRTQETGKALAAGIFPGCKVPVHSLPEGTNDPLFHPAAEGITSADSALATAAIAGRIGGDPANLTEAFRTQLTTFDHILATCGAIHQARTSLFDIPATLTPGKGDHAADLRGPINTASTLSENILLEYTQGMDTKDVAWGCIDGPKLRSLIDIHTAASDFAQRTPAVARMQASSLLDRINRSLEQAVSGKQFLQLPGKPSDRALFLIGHDTNISNIAGLLNLTWIADGRRDDTAPGSTLIFELWQNKTTHAYSVRTYLTVQTLEQMRAATPLSLSEPPQRVPLFLPGCSQADFSCAWPEFSQTLRTATDARYVSGK